MFSFLVQTQVLRGRGGAQGPGASASRSQEDGGPGDAAETARGGGGEEAAAGEERLKHQERPAAGRAGGWTQNRAV